MPPFLRRLFSWRLTPPEGAARPARDEPLEGLRGAAALAVLYAHLTHDHFAVDPGYCPSPLFGLFNIAHAAVLVFFVLSGYVIGLVVFTPATPTSLRDYTWRRFKRLVPINTLAVALGFLASSVHEWRAALANLFFLQNADGYLGLSAPLISTNKNLWSLHYEMVFYVAFAALWIFRPRASLVMVALLIAGFATGLGSSSIYFVSHLAWGALFWMAGLVLAWTRQPAVMPVSKSTWLAAIFAIFATLHLKPLEMLFGKLGFDVPYTPAVVAVDLGYLLPIIWLLAATAGLSPRLERTLGYLSCLPLLVLCLWRLARGLVPGEPYTWLGLTSLLAACVLTRFPISRAHLARLAPIGVISYAVYALAAPIQHIVLSLPLPSGHFSTWIARIVLVVALALGAGYICERTIPRWLKRRRAPCASPS